MTREGDLQKRIDDLRREIRRHDHLYYVLNQPEASDQRYDALFAELKQLDELSRRLALMASQR